VHQTGAEEASTFWTGCGAIRRDVFIEIGGFSRDYRRPSIEDIELGARLRKSGYRIRMLKNMLGKHMKQWRFWNVIHTDIFMRGVPLMLLVFREGKVSTDLNLSYKSRAATVLAGLLGLSFLILILTGHAGATLPTVGFLLGAALAARLSGPMGNDIRKMSFAAVPAVLIPAVSYWLLPDPLALAPLALVAAIVATHLPFYRYVAHKRSGAFAIGVVPLQVLFFSSCAVSIPLAFIQHHLARRRPAD
jgi:cellulose synthase/poly-beta-1,6-N-acetylglucosamine synthase-like glycosyltransferase